MERRLTVLEIVVAALTVHALHVIVAGARWNFKLLEKIFEEIEAKMIASYSLRRGCSLSWNQRTLNQAVEQPSAALAFR
jgi:hypothetical protein